MVKIKIARKYEDLEIGYVFNHLNIKYVIIEFDSKYPFGIFAKAVKCNGSGLLRIVYEFELEN